MCVCVYIYIYIPTQEKEMATHSSVLAWRVPGTEEPGGLWSTGLQKRVRHDLATEQHRYAIAHV